MQGKITENENPKVKDINIDKKNVDCTFVTVMKLLSQFIL